MYYHHPYINGSPYVLWNRLIKRKTGLKRIQLAINKKHKKYHNMSMALRKSYIFWRVCRLGYLDLLMSPELASIVYSSIPYISNDTLNVACRGGHIQVVYWLYSIGYRPIDTEEIMWATVYEHINIIRWLYSIGCDPTFRTTARTAIKHGKLKVIKWLYKNGYDFVNVEAIRLARKYGHHTVIDFLLSIGCPDPR